MSISPNRPICNFTSFAPTSTTQGTTRHVVPRSAVSTTWWRRILGLGYTWADVVRAVDPSLPVGRLRRVTDPRLSQALLTMDEQQVVKGFKFGVLYCKEGQVKENDMFANSKKDLSLLLAEPQQPKPAKTLRNFWTFWETGSHCRTGKDSVVDWMSKVAPFAVPLLTLLTPANTTGTTSLFTTFNNNEIMFHVSTMLPYNPKDPQQVMLVGAS